MFKNINRGHACGTLCQGCNGTPCVCNMPRGWEPGKFPPTPVEPMITESQIQAKHRPKPVKPEDPKKPADSGLGSAITNIVLAFVGISWVGGVFYWRKRDDELSEGLDDQKIKAEEQKEIAGVYKQNLDKVASMTADECSAMITKLEAEPSTVIPFEDVRSTSEIPSNPDPKEIIEETKDDTGETHEDDEEAEEDVEETNEVLEGIMKEENEAAEEDEGGDEEGGDEDATE